MNGCGIRRILQLSIAISYQELRLFDSTGNDITSTCMYSWSSDGVCWTNWANYLTYQNTCKYINGDFYLRILLFGSFDKLLLNDSLSTCYTICLDNSNPFLQTFCDNTNLYQPYNNLDCAFLLQQQLSDTIICMFGIPIYYFQTSPDEESVDYTFKEFSLHNVVAVKQIKLMVADGQMPSSNPKLTDFDFDWETDWEVELGKSQFASAFGDTAFPKHNDFIYVPMMKRMWSVNAAYDEKNEGLMWRSVTWKLGLVKYNDNTNINKLDFDSIIDNLLVNTYENTFEEYERNEQDRLVGATAIDSPTFVPNNLYNISMSDSVRSQWTRDDITIENKQIYQRNSIIARNLYHFNNENGTIVYQGKQCGDSGVLSCILSIPAIDKIDDLTVSTIMNMGYIKITSQIDPDRRIATIGFGDLTCELPDSSTYVLIAKWNDATFTTELNIYKYTYRTDIPEYLLKPEMYYFDYEHPICELTGPYNPDFRTSEPQICSVSAWPYSMTNIKYYNAYLDSTACIKEAMKYTTQHESCVINDLARPIDVGLGYVVK